MAGRGGILMMRISKVRIALNSAGIIEMLNFVGVEGDLGARAERIAAQVNATYPAVEHRRPWGPDLPGSEVPIATASVRGRGVRARARVTVMHPSATAVEAKYGILGAALDAAAGVAELAAPIGQTRDSQGRFLPKTRG